MHIENLIKMANQIGQFFDADPDHALAVEEIRQHLIKFWAPQMRKQIQDYVLAGGEGIGARAKEAIETLPTPVVG
ncbi:formate dehydrogenase subunit delta [Leeia sp. TBRC 13508]|uniref:Formate dehydrogenase subunit delta n=1 Tax=Leeia speluncae TaxID=2884804 RepID=A0ABS8D7M0_9NEIS|nr:formate dehydrogenase subunit delta [Leeia speluncae]MCB6184194.1 formate dehydrogenase subunit delta [Leeia speluncae]